MPSALPRVQVLMPPDVYAQVMTLLNVTGKTKSNMCSELIEEALKTPKYKELLSQADEAQTVAPKEDPRTDARRGSYHRQPSVAVKQERTTPSYMDILEEPGLGSIDEEKLVKLKQMMTLLDLMK